MGKSVLLIDDDKNAFQLGGINSFDNSRSMRYTFNNATELTQEEKVMFRNKKTKPDKVITLAGLVLFFCLFLLDPAWAAPAITLIKGKVTDRGTGLAIANTTVSGYDIQGKLLASTKTDIQGNYKLTLRLISPTRFIIKAESPGYQTQSKSIKAQPLRPSILNFKLLPLNQPPVLAPIGDKTVDEAKELKFTLEAQDPDQDPLTYSASNLPEGAGFDAQTSTFSWTPTYEQAGDYPGVHFEVSDGALTDSEDIIILP